jgi:PAS domain S-box-containing protein
VAGFKVSSRKSSPNLVTGAAEIFEEQANRLEEESSYANLSSEWRDELLDPEGWDAVLDTFAVTMRLAVALTDSQGHILGKCHNPQPTWLLAASARPVAASGCSFCLAPPASCNAVGDALSARGVVMTEDQAGMAHAAVPLFLGDQQLGALIAGQVFSRYPEPLRLQRVARELKISHQDLWQRAVQQVPVSRSTLQLYANLLMSLGQAFLGQRYASILQRKLAQTSERYRLFFDGIRDYALFTVDRAGRVTSWNSGAERLFGYREGEILGQDAASLVVPEKDLQAPMQRRRNQADRAGWVDWEGWRIRKDSTRFLGAAVMASMGKGDAREYGVMVRDITEHRRTEQELQQAQKLEGIGVLAGGIAHDFNNLLTNILLSVNVAKEGLTADDPRLAMLEIAEGASTQAAGLVAQLLAYAGKGKFAITHFDLSDLISEMLPLISASIPKTVELSLSLAPGLPRIKADASQIRQIAMNLIINGAEAIGPEGGTVRVSTGVSDTGTNVFMEVKDSGCGMSEATQAKIFDPFFSTKFTGRGLGLAAVSGIVRGHKGKMQVDSVLGQGTTFTVSFPAVQQPDGPKSVQSAPPFIPRRAGTILVVDDEPKLRRLAGVILERAGYSVLVARDGHEAVETFRQNAAEITAVLMDMSMPVMGGQEASRLIREIRPEVPIIMSSGYGEETARGELGPDTVAGFIQKPYNSAKLVKTIQEAL